MSGKFHSNNVNPVSSLNNGANPSALHDIVTNNYKDSDDEDADGVDETSSLFFTDKANKPRNNGPNKSEEKSSLKLPFWKRFERKRATDKDQTKDSQTTTNPSDNSDSEGDVYEFPPQAVTPYDDCEEDTISSAVMGQHSYGTQHTDILFNRDVFPELMFEDYLPSTPISDSPSSDTESTSSSPTIVDIEESSNSGKWYRFDAPTRMIESRYIDEQYVAPPHYDPHQFGENQSNPMLNRHEVLGNAAVPIETAGTSNIVAPASPKKVRFVHESKGSQSFGASKHGDTFVSPLQQYNLDKQMHGERTNESYESRSDLDLSLTQLHDRYDNQQSRMSKFVGRFMRVFRRKYSTVNNDSPKNPLTAANDIDDKKYVDNNLTSEIKLSNQMDTIQDSSHVKVLKKKNKEVELIQPSQEEYIYTFDGPLTNCDD